MKKRILSIVLCLSMALTLLPTAALATEKTLTLLPTGAFATEKTQLTTALDFTNVGDGEGETPATGSGYAWSGDKTSGYTLALNGLHMDIPTTATPNDAIKLPLDGNVRITVTGENVITVQPNDSKSANGIGHGSSDSSAGAVTMTGGGTLTITAAGNAIALNKDLTLDGITLSGTCVQGGVRSNHGDLTVTKSIVTVASQGMSGSALDAFAGALTITDSTLQIITGSINCLNAGKTLTISGGTATVTNNGIGYPAIVSKGAVNIENGAVVTATNENTKERSYAIGAIGVLSLGEGVKVTALASTSGIIAKSTFTMADTATLTLPATTTVDQIKALEIIGSGVVKVGDKDYSTDGVPLRHYLHTSLNFSKENQTDEGNLEIQGYHWDNAGKTLTLKNLWLEVSGDGNAITLPDGAKLVLQGVSTVIGSSSAICADKNLTISGATGILKAGGTIGSGGRSIEATGTLTVDSGTILSAGNDASMYADAIAIKAGTIDLGARGSMIAVTTLTITGGNVTTGDNQASMLANNINISGGVVKTGAGIQGSICAADLDGGTASPSITITGGTVIANGGNHPDTRIGILAMNGDISITENAVVTATGTHVAILAMGGTITDTGMTATTPAGGTVKRVEIVNPPMTVASYTADATLHVDENGLPTNACTTVSLAKTQTPPVNPPITPPDSGDSDSGSGGGSSGGGDTTPSKPKPEPPKTDPATGNTEVSVPVKPVTKGDTSSATVPEKSVSDAIAAAEKEAAKTGGSASVTVTVDAPKGAKTVETTLSGKSLSAVADGKTEGLKISTPVADLSFDSEALKNIAGMAGKDVKISATRVDTDNLTDAQKSQVGDAPVFDFTVTSDGKTISNFNGGTATVTVPYTPKEGENPEFVTVWLLDDAGKLIPIEAKYKDGKITFETGHFSRYAIGYLPFTDVKAGWAYESIVYAYQNKLFAGVGGNKFAPTANMNRAMLWTVLYRMAGSPGKTETPATWYADAQAWAIAEKISDGTNPDGNITREQLATLLFRYAKATATAADMSGFTDTGDISGFAKDGMSWAVERKILQGNSGKLIPKGNATRAEVAAMLQRFAGLSK